MGASLGLMALFCLQAAFFSIPVQIILDPGHGGIDSGVTVEGVEEKHINLAIAKMLADELEKRGYRVLLTRESDVALSDFYQNGKQGRHRRDLIQRERIGETFQPKLFLSIHANSGSSHAQGGMVIYQDHGESLLLASILQEKLNRVTRTSKRPFHGSRYYLLNRISVPTVLVEVGFLTHPRERELLQQKAYQQQIARALANGIDEYLILVGEKQTSADPGKKSRVD